MRLSLSVPGILFLFLTGCLSDHSERAVNTDPTGWSDANAVYVEIENTDTLSLRNISLFLRYDYRLRTETIRMAVEVLAPDSLCLKDTVVVNVPFTPFQNKELIVPYRNNSVFMQQGVYRFSFIPMEKICGISAVGLKIQNQSSN